MANESIQHNYWKDVDISIKYDSPIPKMVNKGEELPSGMFNYLKVGNKLYNNPAKWVPTTAVSGNTVNYVQHVWSIATSNVTTNSYTGTLKGVTISPNWSIHIPERSILPDGIQRPPTNPYTDPFIVTPGHITTPYVPYTPPTTKRSDLKEFFEKMNSRQVLDIRKVLEEHIDKLPEETDHDKWIKVLAKDYLKEMVELWII